MCKDWYKFTLLLIWKTLYKLRILWVRTDVEPFVCHECNWIWASALCIASQNISNMTITESGAFLQQIVASYEMWCHHFEPTRKPACYFILTREICYSHLSLKWCRSCSLALRDPFWASDHIMTSLVQTIKYFVHCIVRSRINGWLNSRHYPAAYRCLFLYDPQSLGPNWIPCDDLWNAKESLQRLYGHVWQECAEGCGTLV